MQIELLSRNRVEHGMGRLSEVSKGVLEKAALKIRAIEPAFMPVENRCDLLMRRLRRFGELAELLLEAFGPSVENLNNQPLLAREVSIHRHLGDLRLGNDLVFAGGVEAFALEQAIGCCPVTLRIGHIQTLWLFCVQSREEAATNPLSFGMEAPEAATHCLRGVETLTSGMGPTGKAPTP